MFKIIRKITLLLLLVGFFSSVFSGQYNILDYGAVGDSQFLNTRAIQTAIDACTKSGGGTVLVPAGTWLTGTLLLKDNVSLFLESGATLLGSPYLRDYPLTIPAIRSYTDNYTNKSLIYAEYAENISILGQGTINGQGELFTGDYKTRPYLIRMIGCSNVTVKNISLLHSPMWVQHYLECDHVLIDGITVRSLKEQNNDGIDIDSCHFVRIANCDIDSGDDAIVLKSTTNRICRDVVVTNCILKSQASALKCGTESNGGFENITIDNCVVRDTRRSGIALEMVDGGIMDRVTVSNIIVENSGSAIFVRLANRARPINAERGRSYNDLKRPGMGTMRNIMISNVQATGIDSIGSSITGQPGHPIENIMLENIRIQYNGGGTREHAARDVGEYPESYPEYDRLGGPLPAYGFYCRHVNNLKLENIEVTFAQDDERPALVCDDVKQLKVLDYNAKLLRNVNAMIYFKNVQDAYVSDCSSFTSVQHLIWVKGEHTRRIVIDEKNPWKVNKILEMDSNVSKKEIKFYK